MVSGGDRRSPGTPTATARSTSTGSAPTSRSSGWRPFIWSNGGEIVDDPLQPTRFAIGSLNAIRAIQAFLDLRGVAGVTPTDEEAESADFETRFLDGTLAMMMESRKVVPSFRTITDFEWDVAQLPVHRRPATILHSDAYCMTASSERKDQAWAFLEFALGPEGQQIAAATGRTVPSLRSVAESDAFLDPSAAPASSQVFLDNIPHIRAVPHDRDVARDRGRRERAARRGVLRPSGRGRGGRDGARGRSTRRRTLFVRANEG